MTHHYYFIITCYDSNNGSFITYLSNIIMSLLRINTPVITSLLSVITVIMDHYYLLLQIRFCPWYHSTRFSYFFSYCWVLVFSCPLFALLLLLLLLSCVFYSPVSFVFFPAIFFKRQMCTFWPGLCSINFQPSGLVVGLFSGRPWSESMWMLHHCSQVEC